MGIFRQFPYSNFHEMNMDEILKILKTMSEEWDETKTEWASYKDFIDNYFATLDVSEEVLLAIRTLASTGELNTLIDPVIISETASWLAEHITITEGTTVIDNTLSIEGAAADAKATGDAITNLKNDMGEPIVFVKGYADNTKWTLNNNALTGLIPITDGDIIEVLSTSTGTDSRIGILRDVTLPVSSDDVAMWSNDVKWNHLIAVEPNLVYTGIAPSDAKYFYFYYGFISNPNRTPQKVIINGYDYLNDIIANLISSTSKITNLYDFTFNEITNKKIYEIDGTVNLTTTPPVWNGSASLSSLIIPVKGGERLDVYASNEGSSPVSFLRTFENLSGSEIDFSTASGFTTGLTIDQGLVETFIVPNDVRYLVFYKGYKTNPNRTPYAIYINDINYMSPLENDVSKSANNNNKFNTLDIPSIKSVNHGGFHTVAPWNSLPGFKLSIENGFSWVETDVQFTSDNIPVLCHDNFINNYARMSDGSVIPTTVYIYESTLQQLYTYDFGIIKGEEYRGLKITTLEELFRLGRGANLGARIELKENTLPTHSQIDSMIALAKKYGMYKKSEWISTNLEALQYITKKYPDANVVYIYTTMSAVANLRACITNARTLLTGMNQVTIYTSPSISENYARILTNNHFILDVQVSTLEDILNVTPYVNSFTSNYLVVEDALKNYYMNN